MSKRVDGEMYVLIALLLDPTERKEWKLMCLYSCCHWSGVLEWKYEEFWGTSIDGHLLYAITERYVVQLVTSSTIQDVLGVMINANPPTQS